MCGIMANVMSGLNLPVEEMGPEVLDKVLVCVDSLENLIKEIKDQQKKSIMLGICSNACIASSYLINAMRKGGEDIITSDEDVGVEGLDGLAYVQGYIEVVVYLLRLHLQIGGLPYEDSYR